MLVWYYLPEEDLYSEGKSVHISIAKEHNVAFIEKVGSLKEKPLLFSLTPLPSNSPHYLDDENDPVAYDEDWCSFEVISLSYTKDKSRIIISSNHPTVEFFFTPDAMENFSRLITESLRCCSIIESGMEVIVVLDGKEIDKSELMIWGFYNGKPVWL